MEIKKAEFIISNSDPRKCPDHKLPEYAFIGRSNVGKSSLINMLTNRRGLAKTSATPGKTQLINHFLINDSWYIVDLPGYGYAQLSRPEQLKLKKIIEGYILHREQLTCLMLLIDCRHAPLAVDLEFIHFLGRNGVPFAIIFTKLDKLSAKQWGERLEAYKSRLSEDWEELPPMMATSSAGRVGRDEVLDFIEGINENLQKQ
jgi:GTP-binding protein